MAKVVLLVLLVAWLGVMVSHVGGTRAQRCCERRECTAREYRVWCR